MFLNHILSLLGFILLFIQPVAGIVLILLTGIVYFLHGKVEDAEDAKQAKRWAVEKAERNAREREKSNLRDLTADIERLEKEYFDNPNWAFETRLQKNYFLNSTGEPYLIRGPEEYEKACSKTDQTPVFELIEDWEKFGKKINKEAQSKKLEASNHEDSLWKIVQSEIKKGDGRDETQASIYRRYYSLDTPKGDLTARKMRGSWKIKVVSKKNPHLNLEWDVSV